MGKLSSIFLSVLVVLAASCTRPGISVMMCEGAEQPISVGTSTPEYSWSVRDGFVQKEFQIELYDKFNELCWHSERISSGDSSYRPKVPFGGYFLAESYTWKLTLWDDSGKAVTSQSTFETAVVDRGDWMARWLAPADSSIVPGPLTASGQINVVMPVRRVRCYMAATSDAQLHFNGVCMKETGNTANGVCYPYKTYDLTSAAVVGPDRLEVVFGQGGCDTRLSCVVFLEYEDGRTQIQGSNAAWTFTSGDSVVGSLSVSQPEF